MAVRSFRVRHHECDPYGHLNNVAYLRYVEEVEIEAGLAAPAGPLVPADVDITYEGQARFGDRVAVDRRPDDEGTVDYRLAVGDASVARARVRWAPPGGPSPAPDLESGDAEPFRLRRTIDWRDLDETASASMPTLVGLAEDAGVAVCADRGWPLDRCAADGFGIVLRRHRIRIAWLPGHGDEITVSTWFTDRTRTSVVRHYDLRAGDDRAVARFRTLYVWVATDTMRPIRIPAEFIDAFASNEA
ncbi:MAG: acyl-CoA thioesterase [Acidimicrobiia bacterium]|nr:acyl-CoA thioesterase [Acidimicrobiia bacterium]